MSTITTINGTDVISTSRTTINTNFSNLNTDKIETSYLDTDTTLAANSDSKIATQKAVKAYVDTGGNVNASTTTKGIVEEATSSEALLGTATGATGARLFVNPTSLYMVGEIKHVAFSTLPTGWLECDGSAISRSTYSALFTAISTTWGAGDGSTTFNIPDFRNRAIIGAGTGTKVATFASRSGNVITVTGLSNKANNEFQTGQAVFYATTGTVITGLTDDTTYYVVRTGNLTFSLATSLANAIAGTVISLSGDGTGTQTFTLTFTARALGETGGEENHGLTLAEMAAHSHGILTDEADNGNTRNLVTNTAVANSGGAPTYSALNSSSNAYIESKGSSTAHSIMPPNAVAMTIIKY